MRAPATAATGTPAGYPGGETTCKPASCSDGKAAARAVCSGAGVCLPAVEVTCSPYVCEGPICAGGCNDSRPWTAGNYCNAGKCNPLATAGEACTAGDQCATGNCVDGTLLRPEELRGLRELHRPGGRLREADHGHRSRRLRRGVYRGRLQEDHGPGLWRRR